MRIISGKFGGRRLIEFSADHIRPTTDRVKESIFNKMGGSLEGLRVLDLFSGTGSLGLEAISRGASKVVFVDSHVRSVAILKKNLQALDNPKEAQVLHLDVFKFISKRPFESFELILIDPPFTKKLANECMRSLSQQRGLIAENGWIVIESGQGEDLDKKYEGLELFDQRDFGDKVVSFFVKETT